MNTISPFLQKLWDIVNDKQNSDIISWVKKGECFEIFDYVRFSSYILPIFFKTKVFSSFTRQLNMYGFRKLKRDSFIYAHLNFKSNQPDKLLKIIRKKSKINKTDENDGSILGRGINQDFEEIKKWKKYVSKNLAEINQRQNKFLEKLDEFEKKQIEISNELNEIRGDIFEKFADIVGTKG
jgi:acylphosphatase